MISTEGRIFVSQLTRDLALREIAGAAALTPGAKSWNDAFSGLAKAVSKSSGPISAAAVFRDAITRLRGAQKQRNACFVNCFLGRPRSGFLEVIAYRVAPHPLVNSREEGIVVWTYRCRLRRNGEIRIGSSKLAFFSWHALCRLKERSSVDLFSSHGFVSENAYHPRQLRVPDYPRKTARSGSQTSLIRGIPAKAGNGTVTRHQKSSRITLACRLIYFNREANGRL
jgi:hypothetical protein